MKDLFNNEVPVHFKNEKRPNGRLLADGNPMIAYFGPGPEKKRCKHCTHCLAKRMSKTKTYYKCEIRKITNGPGTDIRANWQACGKFENKLN